MYNLFGIENQQFQGKLTEEYLYQDPEATISIRLNNLLTELRSLKSACQPCLNIIREGTPESASQEKLYNTSLTFNSIINLSRFRTRLIEDKNANATLCPLSYDEFSKNILMKKMK